MQNAEAAGEPALVEYIGAAIRERGPVTLAWFMEQALYHPEHGYYSSGRARIGRGGDYFTSVSVGPLFGRLLAAQFAEMWEMLGRPDDFTLVEQGANNGDFASDVLAASEREHEAFFRALRYVIVEPFPVLQARQEATLVRFATRVAWRPGLDQLEPFRGVHFSNELVDSLPLHVVKWSDGQWLQRHVTLTENDFAFIDLPLRDPAVAEQVSRIPTPLPDDYETEVSVAASEWMDAVARKLQHGFVLAVDYGFARHEFYAPHRTRGTWQCYAAHRVLLSPLKHVGHCDMTAHVEWTHLAEHALASGLALAGFTDQHHFLTGLLHEQLAQDLERDPKMARALQTLLQPSFLGMKFQYLVLAKNVALPTGLSGLRFAREPFAALSLSSGPH